MSTVKVRNGRVHSVKVIATAEQKNYILSNHFRYMALTK